MQPTTETKKAPNPHRIKLSKFREQNGLEDGEEWTEYLGGLVIDSVCPALCDEGCEVEPDGRCEHGCPSILLAMGMI